MYIILLFNFLEIYKFKFYKYLFLRLKINIKINITILNIVIFNCIMDINNTLDTFVKKISPEIRKLSSSSSGMQKTNKFSPYVELYRPTNFNDIVLEKNNKKIIETIIKNNYFPNLILSGPPGVGKTTTIINIIKKYQQDIEHQENTDLVMHLNASSDRSIDIIRNQICSFVNSKNLFNKGMKFVILDEADYLTKNAQQALKYLIQMTYNNNVRYCIICNYVSKIDESLLHEFLCLRFNNLPEDKIIQFLEEIVNKENLKLTKDNLQCIQKKFKNDIRSMINFIQTMHSVKVLKMFIIEDTIYDDILNTIILRIPNKKILQNINKISIKYNTDKKTIIKDFINYLKKTHGNKLTIDFIHKISFVMHFKEIDESYYILFVIIQLQKIF